MIEIPRACLTADTMAKTAEFFSFGTNDLTQMSFGFSRDDIGSFLHDYLDDNILRGRPVPDDRPGRRGPVDPDGGGQGPRDARQFEDRHLRRAGRRSGERRVLFPHRIELRQLQPLPRADRAAGRRPSGDQGEEITHSTMSYEQRAHV